MVPSLDILSGAISKKSRITFARHGLPLYHFTQRLQAFYALMPYYPVLFLDEKVASSHLVLNLFNSLAKKKNKQKRMQVKKQSQAIRVTYYEFGFVLKFRSPTVVNCKISYIILSKTIFFDFCLNLSVIFLIKLEQGQTNSTCRCEWVRIHENSGLGQGFFSRLRQRTIKRQRPRLRL